MFQDRTIISNMLCDKWYVEANRKFQHLHQSEWIA